MVAIECVTSWLRRNDYKQASKQASSKRASERASKHTHTFRPTTPQNVTKQSRPLTASEALAFLTHLYLWVPQVQNFLCLWVVLQSARHQHLQRKTDPLPSVIFTADAAYDGGRGLPRGWYHSGQSSRCVVLHDITWTDGFPNPGSSSTHTGELQCLQERRITLQMRTKVSCQRQ